MIDKEHMSFLAEFPSPAFSYNPETELFQIGNREIPLSQYDSYKPEARTPIDVEAMQRRIDGSALLLGPFKHLLQMPRMTNWLKEKDRTGIGRLRTMVIDTMIHAFAATDTAHIFTEKALQKQQREYGGGFMSFSMGILRPGHPVFEVLGSCACMGPIPEGAHMFGQKYWNDGFAEYDLHNIDRPCQEAALMAGAGALAQACMLETTALV